LFENRAAALFALAALLITTTYINQLYFSFRIVYLVPLLTCFIFGFLRTGEAWRLVMAAVVALASVFGSLPYLIIYHTIYGVLLMALLGFIYRRPFRLVMDRAFAYLAPLAVLFIGVSVTLVFGAPVFLAFIAGLGAAALLALQGVRVVALGTLEVGTIQWIMVSVSTLGFLAVVQGGAYTVGLNVIASDLYETPAEVRKTMIRARPPAFEETRLAISGHPRNRAWAAFEPGRHVYQTHMVHYAILGMDPCVPDHPRNRVDVYSPGVDALIRRLWGPDTDARDLSSLYRQTPDNLFFRLAGCDGRPKLQLFSHFEEQALDPAAPVPSSVLARAVLVEDAKGTERRLIRPADEPYPPIASLADQGITVTGFSANRLKATVRVPGSGGAWLVYADAYHPGWRVAVNGRPAKVWKANLAFKALYLAPGDNAVDFDFTYPIRQAVLWFIGLFGSCVLFMGCCAAGLENRCRR